MVFLVPAKGSGCCGPRCIAPPVVLPMSPAEREQSPRLVSYCRDLARIWGDASLEHGLLQTRS
jgi:hypothetical protein